MFKLAAAGLRKFHSINLPPWRFRQMVSTTTPTRRSVERSFLPTWVKPQLAKLIKQAPDGTDWLHEIKLDGYRMHARLDAGRVQILTRRGNDWTAKYPSIAKAIGGLPVQNAYLEDRLANIPDLNYDNAEERRVVLGSEHHAARTLHEAIRYDHSGVCYKVDSPIARRVG